MSDMGAERWHRADHERLARTICRLRKGQLDCCGLLYVAPIVNKFGSAAKRCDVPKSRYRFLFDHLVGEREQGRGHDYAKRSGSLEIDL